MDITAMNGVIRDWIFIQNLEGAGDLGQMVRNGNTLRGETEPLQVVDRRSLTRETLGKRGLSC